jgi:hypothetical protein
MTSALSGCRFDAPIDASWASVEHNGVAIRDGDKTDRTFHGLNIRCSVANTRWISPAQLRFSKSYRGLTALQPTIVSTSVSDHWPVTRSFALH